MYFKTNKCNSLICFYLDSINTKNALLKYLILINIIYSTEVEILKLFII